MPSRDFLRQGAIHHRAGRIAAAAAAYRRSLLLAPGGADAWHALGVGQLQTGRAGRACTTIARAVLLRPAGTVFRGSLARALADTGADAAAMRTLVGVIVLEPDRADAHVALALQAKAHDSLDRATTLLRRARGIAPADAVVVYNLALVLQIAGRPAEAIRLYDQALDRAPAMLDARNNRGRAHEEAGNPERALTDYDAVLAADPGHSSAWNNRGGALRALGRAADALPSLRRALALTPAFPEAAANLGNARWAAGRETEGLAWLRRAAVLAPVHPVIAGQYAGTLALAGHWDAAHGAYSAAVRRHADDPVLGLRHVLTLPQVPDGTAQIAERRTALAAYLADAEDRPAKPIADPLASIGLTGFYLAYHGADDRPLMQSLARFYLRACPSLATVAPHCRNYRGPARRRIRLGICSRYLNSHTIGLLFEGVFERLDRDRFEVVVLRPPGRTDAVSARIDAAADHVLAIPDNLSAARNAVAAAELDALLYTDIGMEPLTYFLSFARLAPVQCVTWGHPDTTGVPSLDYYLSCVPFEPDGAEAHYSEQLIRLPGILMHYRPPSPPPAASLADFGLDGSRPLLLCPQNIFKLHPDYDHWLAGILRRDPDIQVALMEGHKPGWTARLRRRLAAAAPDVGELVRMLPVQPTHRFFQLLSLADAVLDPTHFGGGNTTFHALSLGRPVVTAPGAFMRSRFAAGTYGLIGIDGPVVADADGYCSAAVEFARAPDRRASLSRAIAEAAPLLRNATPAIDALQRFLESAVAAAARGERAADEAW